MSEYWVISAPGDKTCQQTWDTLNNATKSGNLSVNYKFPIPDLKVSEHFTKITFIHFIPIFEGITPIFRKKFGNLYNGSQGQQICIDELSSSEIMQIYSIYRY